jgi:hypothetical protein
VGVLAIWRYPVKAMLGELLRCVHIAPGGIEGDRRWVVIDGETGERIANKRGPTDARLRACRAALDGDRLVVTLPDDGPAPRGPPPRAPCSASCSGAGSRSSPTSAAAAASCAPTATTISRRCTCSPAAPWPT